MLSDVADETGPEMPAQESSTQENPATAPTSLGVSNVAASESMLAGQSRQVPGPDSSERQAKVPGGVETRGTDFQCSAEPSHMTTSLSEKLMNEEVDEIAQQTCSRNRPNRKHDQVEEGCRSTCR